MEEVKVLGAFPSPFSYRVEWALVHKGIKYECIEEDLQNMSPLLLKYNPIHKKISVFVHGEKSIAESLIILEYIEETWKDKPLLPEDPFERAKARFWAKFGDEKIVANIGSAYRTEGTEQGKAVKEAIEALKTLEEELKGKEFFGGKSFGFVDLVVGWIPHWIPVFEEVGGFKLLDADAFPALHAWGHRFLNLPFIKEKSPQYDRMVAVLTNVRKGSLNK